MVETTTFITNDDGADTSILVWEKINGFGLNTTSLDCNGITRLQFIGTPTQTITSLITVTVTQSRGVTAV
jgi:hypothetical protein